MSDAVMTITANDIAGIIESRAEVEDGYLGNAGYIAHEIYLTMLAASPSVGGWEDIATLPHPKEAGLFWAAIRTCGINSPEKWEVHLIALDDETHDVHVNYYQGWDIDQYELWYPCNAPPPPSVSTGSRPQEAVPTEQTGQAVVPGWDQEICTGCTASLSIADIKARGIVSCCPDRHMVRIGDLVDAYTARPPTILPQTEKGS